MFDNDNLAIEDLATPVADFGTGDAGRVHCLTLPEGWASIPDDTAPQGSPLLLLENGSALGPARTPLNALTESASGAYAHVGNKLWFTSRGALSPRENTNVYEVRYGDRSHKFVARANPHFDHDRILWNDEYDGHYGPVQYSEQFDGQWKLFLEGKEGFVRHTGVDTSDEYIDDRIKELTGVGYFLHRKAYGALSPLVRRLTGVEKRAERRGVGGRLYLEPKFPIDYFRGKSCLDIGCGAGRWTRTLLSLGASVKSVDMSEHGLASTRRFNSDVEKLNLFDIVERKDLHGRFDFTLCWGVVMCTHNPLRAFENVALTVRPGGSLYIMVYAPTYHSSDFVKNARLHYHRKTASYEERLAYVYELAGDERSNAINYLDMLNTEYNWTIDEETIEGWARKCGFVDVHFLNADEPHKGAHHVIMRRPA